MRYKGEKVHLKGDYIYDLKFYLFAHIYSKRTKMSKLPNTENTEIFTMRISPKLKGKLNDLAKKSKYGGSASAVIRILIETAYHK